MGRIQDYSLFSNQKKKVSSTDYSFTAELDYINVNIIGRPAEISDVDDIKCEIEYEVAIERKKGGIEDIQFKINLIELEIKVDDYPNENKEFEFDIVPGENVDFNSVQAKKMERIIPSYPSSILIDMRKSMNVGDFKIDVYFGSDGN
jgi:hypothetical protein